MESKREVQTISYFDREMLALFPTVKSYIDDKMARYYSSPTIFKNDFNTAATNPLLVKRFSASIANQLFHVYKKLLAKGRLKAGDAFSVLECGGGDGSLCLETIEMIKQRAKKEKEWADLFDALQYTLLECSPGLAKAQEERTEKYKSKVTVIQGDARRLTDSIKSKSIALMLSNELLDMFQPERATLMDDNTIKINQSLPYISKAELRKWVSKERVLELQEQSNKYKKMLSDNVTQEQYELVNASLLDNILLSNTVYKELRDLIPEGQDPSPFKFHEVSFVSVQALPKLNKFLETDSLFVERMQIGNASNIETGIDEHLRGVKEILIEDGESIAIDYFEDADSLDHNLRTYYKMRQGNKIYEPGDVTHDVNATQYMEAAKKRKLNFVYYNTQDTLSVEGFPPEILSEEDKRNFEGTYRIGSDCFKVAVIENSESESKTMTVDEKRFTGKESLPVFYAELAKRPPLYIVNDVSGDVQINLEPQDIKLIDYYISVALNEMKSLIEEPPIDKSKCKKDCQNAAIIHSGLTKMKNRQILSNEEKHLLEQTFLQFRLQKYPSERDIIACHLKKLTGIDWQVDSVSAFAKINIPDLKKVGPIKLALTRVGVCQVNTLMHPHERDHILLRIQGISNPIPWGNIYSGKPKLTSFIHSPITASGDAHANLMRAIHAKLEGQTDEFKVFLEALQERDYPKALRRICTATSDSAYDVTKLFLEKCRELKIKFDINQAAGVEKLSALHHAARKNNHKLYRLLVDEFGADVKVVDAKGEVPTLSGAPSKLKMAS